MEAVRALKDVSFLEVLKGRRSVRHFTDEYISDEELKGIIEDAAWAPSPGNSQEWEVVALSYQQTRRILEEFEDLGWEYIFPLLREVVRRSHRENNQTVTNLNSSTHEFYRDYLKVKGSPRLLLICKRKKARHQQWWTMLKVIFSGVSPFLNLLLGAASMSKVNANLKSAGLANLAYAITLSAYSKGIATCIQGVYSNLEKVVVSSLGLDKDIEIFLSVLIGYEDESRAETPPVLTTRRPVAINWID